jgi:propionyl-CoA carboxylase beta chain
MFITGPDVIKTVTHEEVTKDQLGGATTHNETSGVAHFLSHDDAECLSMVRELLSFVPSNNLEDPPRRACTDPIDRADPALDKMVPAESNRPYDIKDVIHAVIDDGYFFEAEYCGRLCPLEWALRGDRREPTRHARGDTRHQRVHQRRALCALLRLL